MFLQVWNVFKTTVFMFSLYFVIYYAAFDLDPRARKAKIVEPIERGL